MSSSQVAFGPGVYRDKLKPLLDSKDAGHLLSIFSYSGEGACIEHVDRGFITLDACLGIRFFVFAMCFLLLMFVP